jgi:AraC-like DNA-binding protein
VPVSYSTRRPSPRLAGIVERLWRVEDPRPSGEPETICPDGRSEIVIHLGEAMEGQPRHLLVGQMDAPLTITPSGRVAMVGARLSPAGLHRLLPIPQDCLMGQIISLETVWNAWTRQTADQISAAPTPDAELDAFERALEALVPADRWRASDRGVSAALAALRASGGNASIARIASDTGVSRRQLERRFREQVGLPPRLYARIVRFQRAFQALGHESGAAIAANCGYADQAHLVREIRRFAGQTPGLLAEADGLTAFFRH